MAFTEAEQLRAIANVLAGRGMVLIRDERELLMRPTYFDEPWDSIFVAASRAATGQEHEAVQSAIQDLPLDERERVRVKMAAAQPDPSRFPSLEELAEELEPIQWLWEDWIPLGMIAMLGAVPGGGKSLVALDLARRIFTGEGFPDGADIPCPGAPVVYVDAEAVPQLTNERAERWGMDRSKLFLMLPVTSRMFIDFGESEDREYLWELVERVQPGLVIVDSLSTISSRGENDIQDVREIMAFLNQIARQQQCGLLLVHHLRKSGGTRERDGIVGIEDLRGSGHIVAIARSVLGLSIVQTGPKIDRNGPRRIEIIKTNLGPYPAALGVEFVSIAGGGVELRYGEPPVLYKAPTTADACEEWLIGLLEECGEPIKPREVVELGKKAQFGKTLIYEVRDRMEGEGQLVNTRGRKDSRNLWALPWMVEVANEEKVEGE